MLLECLAQDHMAFLATMEPQVFLYILSSISEGLTALGANLNYFTGTRGGRIEQDEKLPFGCPSLVFFVLLCYLYRWLLQSQSEFHFACKFSFVL